MKVLHIKDNAVAKEFLLLTASEKLGKPDINNQGDVLRDLLEIRKKYIAMTNN